MGAIKIPESFNLDVEINGITGRLIDKEKYCFVDYRIIRAVVEDTARAMAEDILNSRED